MGPIRTLLTSRLLTLAFAAAASFFGIPDGYSESTGRAFGGSDRRAVVLDVNAAGDGIPYANSDAKTIADLLETRFDFKVGHKQSVSPDSLLNDTWELVNDAKGATEQIVVYFRGYLRVEQNSAWLMGVDSRGRRTYDNSFEVNRLVKTLHSIKGCPLATVLLDVVSENSQTQIQRALKTAIAGAGSGDTPVAILAGSSSEANPTWSQVGQSRMSYWMVDGLRGAAISRARPTASFAPEVLLDKLVEHIKPELAGHSDLSYVTSSTASTSAVVTPTRVKTMDELIVDLATRMAAQLTKSQIATVVIPDFEVSGPRASGVPGNDYGPLLRYAAAKFKSELSSRTYGAVDIAESSFILEILTKHNVAPDTIHTDEKLADLLTELQNETGTRRTAVLFVTLEQDSYGEEDSSPDVTLRCSPFVPRHIGATGKPKSVFGHALLNSSEWSMIGRSAVNQKAAREYLTAPLAPGGAIRTISTTRIEGETTQNAVGKSGNRIDNARRPTDTTTTLLDLFQPDDVEKMRDEVRQMQKDSGKQHPLLDEDFPWRISIKVDGKSLATESSDDERHLYVHVPNGTNYVIGAENRSEKPVFMRLLVDGLNTLPDRPLLEKKGKFEAATKDPDSKLLPAQHASLTNARAWFCEGRTEKSKGVYEVRGFFTGFEAGQNDSRAEGKRDAFVVTDAQSSEAAIQGYHKDIGIITAAFYEPHKMPTTMSARSGSRAVSGTKRGESGTEVVEMYSGKHVPGRLLGVVHLRYGIPKDAKSPQRLPVVQ